MQHHTGMQIALLWPVMLLLMTSFHKPYVRPKTRPTKEDLPSDPAHMAIWRNFDKVQIFNEIMYRETYKGGNQKYQVTIPASCLPTILTLYHYDMGHPGRDKSISLVQDKFFWHKMTVDMEKWIQKCRRCILSLQQSSSHQHNYFPTTRTRLLRFPDLRDTQRRIWIRSSNYRQFHSLCSSYSHQKWNRQDYGRCSIQKLLYSLWNP